MLAPRTTLLLVLASLAPLAVACDDDDDGCYSPFCPCEGPLGCEECSAFECDVSDCNGQGQCSGERGDDSSYTCVDIDHCSASCGDACRLGCAEASSCELECGEHCDVDCVGASDCYLQAGAGSSLSCYRVSQCSVLCSGPCEVACLETSTCEVSCQGAGLTRVAREGGFACVLDD